MQRVSQAATLATTPFDTMSADAIEVESTREQTPAAFSKTGVASVVEM